MTLECFNQRPLTVVDACRDYMVRRGVLDRLLERQGMSADRHRLELEELNGSLHRAMESLVQPTLADELATHRNPEAA